MSIVLDASLALTWCFEDERRDDTVAIGRQILAEGATSPGLFRLVLANSMLVAERKNRITGAQIEDRLDTISAMPIAIDSLTTEVAWTDTLRLAREEKLTLYDATYLELALPLGADLATLDKDLIAAAGSRSCPKNPP